MTIQLHFEHPNIISDEMTAPEVFKLIINNKLFFFSSYGVQIK
jgi:hypothetical protein